MFKNWINGIYLPSSFGDDHFCTDAVEFAPEVAVF